MSRHSGGGPQWPWLNTGNLMGHCGLLGHEHSEDGRMIRVNRAPVLTLWATVVAERLGFERDAALTLGRAVAGSSAQMKGRALGIYEPSEEPSSKAAEERQERLKPDETFGVRLLGRTVPAIRTPDGIRAMEKDFRPASAASVGRYLASKFGDHLDEGLVDRRRGHTGSCG